MKPAKGFNLIELMISIVILSIIVSVAVPSYRNYVIRGKIPDATSQLASKRVAMEQYYQDNRTYLQGAACPTTIAPDTTSSKYFDFTCVANATPPTYTLTATGKSNMAGFVYTVDQANNKQTTGAPAGWGGGAAPGAIPPNPVLLCWVINTNGQC